MLLSLHVKPSMWFRGPRRGKLMTLSVLKMTRHEQSIITVKRYSHRSLGKHAENLFAETVTDNMLRLLRERKGHLGSWKQKREDSCHEHITKQHFQEATEKKECANKESF